MTQDIQFFPEARRAGAITRPDFLWRTSFGDLYVECKRSPDAEDDFRERAERLQTFVQCEFQSVKSSELRWDFIVDETAGAERSIRRLIKQARTSLVAGVTCADGDVTLTLRDRFTHPPTANGEIRLSIVPANVTPVPLGPGGAAFTLAVSATQYWKRVVMRLLRDARGQLPTDSLSAVMVSLPSASAGEAAVAKVQAVARGPAYDRTPWIGIWAQEGLTVVHRQQHALFGATFTAALAHSR